MKNTPIRFLLIYSFILIISLVLVRVSSTVKDSKEHHLNNKEASHITGQWYEFKKPLIQQVSYNTTKPIDLKYINPKRTVVF